MTLNYWKKRKLKLKGKVVVVNALLMSKMCVYLRGYGHACMGSEGN